MKRTILMTGAAAVAALALAACGANNNPTAPAGGGGGSTASAGGGSITVGSADFSESQVLGEIYAGAIKAKGITVTTKPNIGSRDVYIKALQDGSIDIVPEYTGSLLTFLKGTAPTQDPDAVYAALKADACRPPSSSSTSRPPRTRTPWSSPRTPPAKFSLKSIADLTAHQADITVAAPPEFQTRQQGLVGLKSEYGFAPANFLPLKGAAIVNALTNGQAQAANIFSTDPSISANGFVTLEDPKLLFGSDNVVPLIAQGQGQRHHHRRAQRGLGQDRHGHPDRPGQAGRRRQEGRVGRGQGLPVEERPGLTEGVPQPWILHVDLDQFVAAVEVLRDPSLVGKPVVVGGRGDPTLRGVVSTASYEARVFGVGSGMPLRTAVEEGAGRGVPAGRRSALRRGLGGRHGGAAVVRPTDGAVVEVLGWDEAFVGVTTDDPEALARRMQAAVLEQTRLHCSVGIGADQGDGQDGHRVREAAGRLHDHRGHLVRDHGPPPDRRALGRRAQDRGQAGRAGHRDGRRSWPSPTPSRWSPGSARRWARGTAGSRAAATAHR